MAIILLWYLCYNLVAAVGVLQRESPQYPVSVYIKSEFKGRMQAKFPLLRLISGTFKVLALVIAVAAVIGALVQFAIFFGLFPADFYFNSTISSAQGAFLPGGIAALIVGLLTAAFWYAFARILDLLMSIAGKMRSTG